MTTTSPRPLRPAHGRQPRPQHRVCEVGLPLAFTPGCLVILDGDLELASEVLQHLSAGLHGTSEPMWDHAPVLTVRPAAQRAHSVHVVQQQLQKGQAVIAVGEAAPDAVAAGEPLADLTVTIIDGDAPHHRTRLLSGTRAAGLHATATGPHLALRTLGLLTAMSQAGLTGVRSRR